MAFLFSTLFGTAPSGQLLASQSTITGVSNMDLNWTNPAGASGVRVYIRNLDSVSSAKPQLRGSIDGGSTHKSGASDYEYYANIINSASSDQTADIFQFTVDSTTSISSLLILDISFPEQAGDHNTFLADVFRGLSDRREQSGGVMKFDTKINGISFFFSVGNISRADIEVYSI